MLATSDSSIAVALALRLHLLNATHPISADLLPLFDERVAALSADPRSTLVDVQTIFDFLVRIVIGLDVRDDTTVLVQALIFVEHLMRACPNCLGEHTWRPILLTACILSMKKDFDEKTVGIVHGLHRTGVTGIDSSRLLRYETAFLARLGWNVEVSRREYIMYIFALRDALSRHVAMLRQQLPEMITLALALGSTDSLDCAPIATPKPVDDGRLAPRLLPRTPPAVPTWVSDEHNVAVLYGLVLSCLPRAAVHHRRAGRQ